MHPPSHNKRLYRNIVVALHVEVKFLDDLYFDLNKKGLHFKDSANNA
jgi:hypothetical protein